MMQRTLTLLVAALVGFAAGLDSLLEAAAYGIPELEAVDKALQKVATAKLCPKLQAAAQRAVKDVEKVSADLQHDHKLTKDQKKSKIKGAIQKLQSLQSQWELAAVEASLQKVINNHGLSPQQISAAKQVAADVDAIMDEVEKGKLDGDGQRKKVAVAIQKLQGLEHELSTGAGAAKEAKLKHMLAEKKLLLKEKEEELKLNDLEKQLLEKKEQLQQIVAAKSGAEAEEKQRRQMEEDHEQISQLIAAAKSLASARKVGSAEDKKAAVKIALSTSATKGSTGKVDTPKNPANSTEMKAILADLRSRVKQEVASLAKFDAEYNDRIHDLQKAVIASKRASNKGSRMTARRPEMLESALKRQQHMHMKARASKVAQISNLRSGIQSIEKGDAAALSSLLVKMRKESKSMQAQGQNFLH